MRARARDSRCERDITTMLGHERGEDGGTETETEIGHAFHTPHPCSLRCLERVQAALYPPG